MNITNIRLKITKSAESDSLLGVASVQFDNQLVIHDVKLVKLKTGKRVVSFPNKKIKKFTNNGDGFETSYEYTDLVHPSNSEFRNYIETELFKIYDSEINKTNINEEGE